MTTTLKFEYDSDSEYEEEERIVYCDLKNILWNSHHTGNKNMKIIGIDTMNPVFEVNGVVFEGAYDFDVGTNVFFELDKPSNSDPLFSQMASQNYKLVEKTDKVISVHRILTEKDNEDENQLTESLESNEADTYDYEDAIKLISLTDPQLPTSMRLDILKDFELSSPDAFSADAISLDEEMSET